MVGFFVLSISNYDVKNSLVHSGMEASGPNEDSTPYKEGDQN